MRILLPVAVILLTCSLCGAQSTTAIQTGFAIITPASQIPGNLLVSETLINVDGEKTFQSGIEATPLVTNIMFVLNTAPLLRDTGFAAVNPNNTAATLTVVLRNGVGNVVVCKSVVVQARQQLSRFLTEVFKDQGFTLGTAMGLLSINSTLPVGIVGLQFSGTAFSTLPLVNRAGSTALTPDNCTTAPGGGTVFQIAGPNPDVAAPLLTEVGGGLFSVPSYAAGVGGPGAVLLPQFVTGGTWRSEIVIANVSTVPQIIRVDFFAANGTPMAATSGNVNSTAFTNVTIPPGGVATFSSRID